MAFPFITRAAMVALLAIALSACADMTNRQQRALLPDDWLGHK